MRRNTMAAVAAAAVAIGAASLAMPAPSSAADPRAAYVPKVGHVFVINIENKGYEQTWGSASAAPYLAKTLRGKGVLLNSYYGTAHNSMPNYVAQITGQGPNLQMQADCQIYADFWKLGTTALDQAIGTGCVLPKGTPNLPAQLDGAGKTWKGYMQSMGTPCRHPKLGAIDDTQKASATNEYATRHNPFVYLHSVIDNPAYCASHVVDLSRLTTDLKTTTTTPNLSYLTPDLCNDGHDAPCADGRPGGLASVDAWMKVWVPRILASPAYQTDGMLIITADEFDGPTADSSACCGEGAAPNAPLPGLFGHGGGKIGALVLSKWTTPGSWSTRSYNHYSLLASVEDIYRLPYAGYARSGGLPRFGLDIYNNGWNS